MKRYRLHDISTIRDIAFLTITPKNKGGRLDFQPGQYITIGFRGTGGRLSPMRCFSITSSALDSSKLQLACRIGGAFTRSLTDLRVGDDILVQGPFGEFTIDEGADRRAVMIAGGIGITPFMSMIRTATDAQLRMPMTLLYSYRSGHDIPFHDELRELESRNPYLRVIMFVTSQTTPPETPRMLSGRMTGRHIDQVTQGEYTGSTYFICGPKGFTDTSEALLLERGISDDRLISESFTQSSKVTVSGGYSVRSLTYVFASVVLAIGLIGIAGLDLSRYVPKHTTTAATTSAQTVKTTKSNANGSGTSGSSATSSSGSSSTSSSNSSSTSGSSSTSSYQQPVSSVS